MMMLIRKFVLGASINYVGKILPIFDPLPLRRQVYYISFWSSIGILLTHPSPLPAQVVYGCPLYKILRFFYNLHEHDAFHWNYKIKSNLKASSGCCSWFIKFALSIWFSSNYIRAWILLVLLKITLRKEAKFRNIYMTAYYLYCYKL